MLLAALLLLSATPAAEVREIDLAAVAGLHANAAGPLLLRADPARRRVVVANTLTSTLTVVDTDDGEVHTIPVGLRAVQHLKAEALAVRPSTGEVAYAADRGLVIVDPGGGGFTATPTWTQLESLAFDDATGNLAAVGRDDGALFFWDAAARDLQRRDWVAEDRAGVEVFQTPPPAIRKVISVPGKKPAFAAVDGVGATLTLFDARTGKPRGKPRALPLTPGGRWHLAGVAPDGRALYLVTETADRHVLQAARIALGRGEDLVVPLPGLTEGVAMLYEPGRDRLIVNYDNHPLVHVVDFARGGALREVALPAYGNDAAVLDPVRDKLYVGSWSQGEVEVVDLATLTFERRIGGLGILPHMHAMTLDPTDGSLYFPVGATGVNGTFGASLTRLDPASGEVRKIRTGFAPIDLVAWPERGSVLVFGNDDRLAEIRDGEVAFHDLPRPWPVQALRAPDGRVALAYGPHQSYWPVVYIHAARDGLLLFDPGDLSVHDRRLPRQALDMVYDPAGRLFLTQCNWGDEQAFVARLDDEVRDWTPEARLELPDEVGRETTQRLVGWDPGTGRLVHLRAGERDADPTVLSVIDPATGAVERRLDVGACATDLLVEPGVAWVAAFGRGDVDRVDLTTGQVERIPSGGARPLRLARLGEHVYALDADALRVRELDTGAEWSLPVTGKNAPFLAESADALIPWAGRLVVTAHAVDRFRVLSLDPATGEVAILHERQALFGQVGFDSGNSAFRMCGQYGDAVFTLTPWDVDAAGRLWIADFLSGRVLSIAE